jgi:hypothetical protein
MLANGLTKRLPSEKHDAFVKQLHIEVSLLY